MAVGPSDNIRVILRLVGTGETLYANTYYCKLVGGASIPESQVLSDMEDWATSMLGHLDGVMDSEIDLGDCQVDLVEVEGVYNPDPELNTAKVSVVRPIGYISPAFSPVQVGEELDGISTGSVVVKCFTPGPKPRKSISGFTEALVSQKILSNAVLSALTSFAISWLAGPSFSYFVGTMSLVSAIFEAFDGTFTIKNTGGTQVTRKIGRGS
jgi:hypothetical protein